jgi:putative Ca2+/H+ antiporter (TMEM165/GDT1 family)
MGGALYLLATAEQAEQARGEQMASGEEKAIAGGRASFWRVAAITFGVVVVAEFGDITQVLIANLAAHYRDRVAVFSGAAAGFALVSVVGVLAGRTVTRFVPLSVVRRVSGAALLGFGIYLLVSLATS